MMRVYPHCNLKLREEVTRGNNAQSTGLPVNTARCQTGTEHSLCVQKMFEDSMEAIYSGFDQTITPETTRQQQAATREAWRS